MKKFQILNLAIIVLLLFSCSSDDNTPNQELTGILGEWEAVDECKGDTCWGLGVTYDYLRFNSNGTVTEGRDNPLDEITLEYVLDGKNFSFTQVFGDGSTYTSYHTIITLTETEFVFEGYGDEDGDYDEIERYYFIKTDN